MPYTSFRLLQWIATAVVPGYKWQTLTSSKITGSRYNRKWIISDVIVEGLNSQLSCISLKCNECIGRTSTCFLPTLKLKLPNSILYIFMHFHKYLPFSWTHLIFFAEIYLQGVLISDLLALYVGFWQLKYKFFFFNWRAILFSVEQSLYISVFCFLFHLLVRLDPHVFTCSIKLRLSPRLFLFLMIFLLRLFYKSCRAISRDQSFFLAC